MRIRQISAMALTLVGAVFAPLVHAQNPTLVQAPTLLTQGSTVTLAQALKAAHNNFDVALARSAAAAALADVLTADHAPLPTLSAKFSAMDLQNGIGGGSILGDKRIDKGIGIDWTWERGNKRGLRTRAAQRNASAAQSDLEDMQIQQLLTASAAFFDLTAAQERVIQVEAIAAGTAQIASTAARRVKAGDLAHQDALRLEIESERAKGDVLAATLERQRAALVLASLLGVDAAAPAQTLQTQGSWPTPGAATVDADPTDSAMQAWVDARPDLHAAMERVVAAQAALEGAGAQKKSDITWGVSLDHFPGTSTSLLELRMQMPLQFGYQFQGETGRAQAQLTAAQDALDKARRAAALELQGMNAQLQSVARRSQSFEQDILPRARQVAAQAELAYAKGALALNDLLDARRTLRATGLDALAARADHAKAVTAWRLRTQPIAVMLAE
jgi:cobalt-zinc-cadmium efflux system outer membrane protein